MFGVGEKLLKTGPRNASCNIDRLFLQRAFRRRHTDVARQPFDDLDCRLFDDVWLAHPGIVDPAGPGLLRRPQGSAGKRVPQKRATWQAAAVGVTAARRICITPLRVEGAKP